MNYSKKLEEAQIDSVLLDVWPCVQTLRNSKFDSDSFGFSEAQNAEVEEILHRALSSNKIKEFVILILLASARFGYDAGSVEQIRLKGTELASNLGLTIVDLNQIRKILSEK